MKQRESQEPSEAYNALSMDGTRRVGGTRTVTEPSSACDRKARAGFRRRVALQSRILSQLMVRPITDSRHRAFETQATNLHPPSIFSPLYANWHPSLTFPNPLTTWVSVWLAAIQNLFSSKPWLKPRTHGRGGDRVVGAVCGCAKPALPFSP